MKLRHIHSYNGSWESSLDFVEADGPEFSSALEFYAEATRMLFEGYESAEETEKYIAKAKQDPSDPQKLSELIQWVVKITPIDNAPELKSPEGVVCMRDDWNLLEYVWREGTLWRMFSWGTSA